MCLFNTCCYLCKSVTDSIKYKITFILYYTGLNPRQCSPCSSTCLLLYISFIQWDIFVISAHRFVKFCWTSGGFLAEIFSAEQEARIYNIELCDCVYCDTVNCKGFSSAQKSKILEFLFSSERKYPEFSKTP